NILPRLKNVNQNIEIVDLAAEINRIYPDREFAPGQRDPHIWLSPKRVQAMIDIISREMAEIDPLNKATYESNAKDYQDKLAELDTNITNLLPSGSAFVVYHPAFGYFADDYKLQMVAIEKNGKTATAEDIQNIIDFSKRKGIKTIFYQPAISSRQADTIAAEIAGHTKVIDPLAADYINNMEEMACSISEALK
ncbi:MAG TPA: zinc ABC transporter substrate-binding protein, partial [Anaerovoracaceae bacterium]|nr:zinc ABC transporter substrate-binding protein [Anaerovoracaceae bacterium]